MRLSRCALLALIPLTVLATDSSSTATAATTSTSKTSAKPSSSTTTTTSSSDTTSSTSTRALSTSSSISTESSSSTILTSALSSKGSSTMSLSKSSSTSDALPTLPRISVTATSSSSYIVTFTAGVPNTSLHNPNIQTSTLPSGLTFIAIGAALGLAISIFILALCIRSLISKKQAYTSLNQESETFEYQPDIFQEKRHDYSVSVYSLGSGNNSLDYLHRNASNASMGNITGIQAGRSYRNALNRASRASLFISPTAVLSLPQTSLPQGSMDWTNSPIESPETSYSGSNIDVRTPLPKRSARPPSVVMDQMFRDDSSVSSQNDSSGFNSPVYEKV